MLFIKSITKIFISKKLLASVFFTVHCIISVSWAENFTHFESGQVRPLALSLDGTKLFALNTPDNRLEIFRIENQNLHLINSIVVGLEPVALAIRSNDEVWVVNHLSDSVNIVKLDEQGVGRVVRTLLVGDEPRDIIFAGTNQSRAFITTAHRGQNTNRDPQLMTPGIGRADVWVFDVNDIESSQSGTPLTVLTLFTDTPRALAANNDGSIVYAAGFHTGNRTTVLNDAVVERGVAPPFNRIVPGLLTNYAGEEQPDVSLIVKYDGEHWIDELGQYWDDMVPFSLPDHDVFTIDANATPPAILNDRTYSGVGTVLFNMIVNPKNDKLYVSNLESFNHIRFEGKGIYSNGQTVRGHLSESRITVIGGDPVVAPRHLNKHIDYSQCCAPIPNVENSNSIAFPLDMEITNNGKTLFVAAFGTKEVAVYNTEELENDQFIPNANKQIPVSGGGPSGLALDEKKGLLYVLTRFDNSISVIDIKKKQEINHIAMHNPEPKHIIEGRPFLYDASFSSSHGDSACASCHIFGDLDSLAWDLGDPDGDEGENTGPFKVNEIVASRVQGQPVNPHFRPMKGPMTTQSLRGMDNQGPMHWRGDRSGGNDENALHNSGLNIQPNGGSFDENKAFRKFNVAFPGLLGRHKMIPAEAMQKFTEFILDLSYPPNPIRNLDNSLTQQQKIGHDFFFSEKPSDSFFSCNGCHVTDRLGNAEFEDVNHPGFFGTDGQSTFDRIPQFFKIPHLRNMYQKVGMFGMAPQSTLTRSVFFLPLGNLGDMGPQIRGFGFTHDGSVDTLFRFFSSQVFLRPFGFTEEKDENDNRTPIERFMAGLNVGNPNGFGFGPEGIAERRNVEAFMLAFDSNSFPIVGQQITLNYLNKQTVSTKIELLINQANTEHCDLVVTNKNTGFLYQKNGMFKASRQTNNLISHEDLKASVVNNASELTYMCVPVGSGYRIGLDRDMNGILNNDEIKTGDLNQDGDIDRNDLDLLQRKIGMSASIFDPLDIDGDGSITVLDVRKLVNLCSRPNCKAL